MTVIVLAGHSQETNAFSRSQGLPPGVRHIVNRDTLKAVRRPTEIHVLPSFYQRRDIHALKAELARLKRQNPLTPWIEWERGPGATYERVEPFEPEPDPPVNPKRTPKPKKPANVAKNADDAVKVEVDQGPNAVPGQTAIEEHLDPLADIPVDQASVAAQSPRSDPDDAFLDFLDEDS